MIACLLLASIAEWREVRMKRFCDILVIACLITFLSGQILSIYQKTLALNVIERIGAEIKDCAPMGYSI